MNCCKRILSHALPSHKHRPFYLIGANFSDATRAISPSRMCVEEAQTVMGYSPPFFKRWLEHEEIDDIAFYLQKLAGTKHPLINIAKNSFFRNESPAWGLIVLLLSRATGVNNTYKDGELDNVLGILNKQRILAEITELLRTSILIHKGIRTKEELLEETEIIKYGNKISLLSGDYLFSRIFHDLAHLRSTPVFSIVATALRDLSEQEFLPVLPGTPRELEDTGLFEPDNMCHGPYNVDMILGNCREEWIMRNLLSSANLLGKSCQATLLLAGHDKQLQDKAYLFGKHLALAWQANLECEAFKNYDDIEFTSLPVMLHLSGNSGIYDAIEQGRGLQVRTEVMMGGALEEAKVLQVEFANRALDYLSNFRGNSATESLEKLLLLFIVN